MDASLLFYRRLGSVRRQLLAVAAVTLLLRAFALLLAVAAVTLLLGACATPAPTQPIAAAARAGAPIAVATLATNACEAAVAPAYTAAITAARQAEARLRAGRLSVTAAEQVLQLGRAAQADLDAACPHKTLDAQRLRSAQAAVARMQALLKD